MSDFSNQDIKRYRALLVAHKGEILADVETSAGDRRPVELDQSTVGRLSRMDALQGQAMALETERRREVELDRIERALERMDAGAFGYCTACDEPIAAKRLELDPAVPTCIDCASN